MSALTGGKMFDLNMRSFVTLYRYWTIEIEIRLKDEWWYTVRKGTFQAEYGPIIGPESALESGKILVDILEQNIHF